MNMLFASEREREMMLLKKKKLKSILIYNLQEMQRKRTLNENQKFQHIMSYQTIASQISENLNLENHKSFRKKQLERSMLRESYERQIRDKQQKMRIQKQREREFSERQKAFSDYEEARRIAEIQKMFDRKTYQGAPINNHKRAKTQSVQPHNQTYNPEPPTFHLPRIGQKPQQNVQQSDSIQKDANLSSKKNLNDVFVETFHKPKGMPQKNLN